MTTLRVASLFCGAGGFDYGFHKSDKFNVVYANDFNKDACSSYEGYYKFKPEHKDIKLIETLPDCDIMLGGFPCQGFTTATKERDINDNRNKLYLELVRLLKLKKPKYFIFENVKGLLSMGGYETKEDKKQKTGRVFKQILDDLTQCGYKVQHKLFRMKYYNTAQMRERVIILGIRNDINKTISFPPESKTITKTLNDCIGDLKDNYDEKLQHINNGGAITTSWGSQNRIPKWDNVGYTVLKNSNRHPDGRRRLTARENARLQGYPDDFKFIGSNNSIRRQIGNSVPIELSVILSKLF